MASCRCSIELSIAIPMMFSDMLNQCWVHEWPGMARPAPCIVLVIHMEEFHKGAQKLIVNTCEHHTYHSSHNIYIYTYISYIYIHIYKYGIKQDKSGQILIPKPSKPQTFAAPRAGPAHWGHTFHTSGPLDIWPVALPHTDRPEAAEGAEAGPPPWWSGRCGWFSKLDRFYHDFIMIYIMIYNDGSWFIMF